MKKTLLLLLSGIFILSFNAYTQCTQTVTYKKTGIFHVPSPGNETVKYNIPIASGKVFTKITVELDVTRNKWDDNSTHSVFWLNRGDKWRGNNFGYVNLFPDDKVKMAYNVEQPAGVMLKKVSGVQTTQGETYHFKYTYDAKNNQIKLIVTDKKTGVIKATLTDVAQVSQITSDPYDNSTFSGFFIWCGHEDGGATLPEAPTYGWEYANLSVEIKDECGSVPSPTCTAPEVFEKKGTFFTPAQGTPTHRVNLPVSSGATFSRLEVDVDVTHNGWYSKYPFGDHSMFWINRGTTYRDHNFGWVTMKGPQNNLLRNAHNAGNGTSPDVAKTKTYAFQKGNTYHVKYIYDTQQKLIEVIIFEAGNQLVKMTDIPLLNTIDAGPDPWIIEFGHKEVAHTNDTLSPTYGWEYANLKVQFITSGNMNVSTSPINTSCSTCSDGAATATAFGGTSPYTYQWSNGSTGKTISGLTPGTYSVVVTDSKGCSGSATAKINTGKSTPTGLEPYSLNPQYWQWNGSPVMLLGGNPCDNSWQVPDHRGYIDQLVSVGGNYVRCNMSHYQSFALFPFAKVNGKYDLNQFNNAHWSKFEDYLTYAEQHNIILHITFWDRFEYYQSFWQKNPWNPANNSTYTSAQSGLATDYPGRAVDMGNPFWETVPMMKNNTFLLNYQKKYIDKLLSHTLKHKNIIYNIANEHNPEHQAFIEYWVQYIWDKAKAAGVKTNVTMMYADVHWQTVVDQPALYSYVEGTKVASKSGPLREGQYNMAIGLVQDVAAKKVRPVNAIKCRTQEIIVNAQARVWRLYMAGYAGLSHHMVTGKQADGYQNGGLGFSDTAQYNIMALRKFSNTIPPWSVSPRQDLLSNRTTDEAYCLADPGNSYGIYFPEQGEITLDMTAATGKFNMHWIDIFTGQWGGTSIIQGGSKVNIKTPGPGSWAVAIVKASIPKPNDVEILEVQQLMNISCDETPSPKIYLVNNGSFELTSLTLNHQVDGKATVSKTITVPAGSGIQPGNTFSLFLDPLSVGPGVHSIKIWTSNPNGTPDPDVSNDTLSDDFVVRATGLLLDISSTFDNGKLPASWSTVNKDLKETWFVFNGAGYKSNSSLAINNYSYTGAKNEPDEAILPPVDLTSTSNAYLSFYLAHQSKPGKAPQDSLEVQLSVDCGDTYTTIWAKGGDNLNTVPDDSTLFIPKSDSDWRQEVIDISKYTTSDHAMIRFVNYSNNNNSTLIDMVNITASDPSGTEDLAQETGFTIFPNPGRGIFHIRLENNMRGNSLHSIRIFDISGRIVFERDVLFNGGTATIDMNSQKSGLYLVELKSEKSVSIAKLKVLR